MSQLATDLYIACMREVGLHDIADLVLRVYVRPDGWVHLNDPDLALHNFNPDITVVWEEFPEEIFVGSEFIRYHGNAMRIIQQRLEATQ